MINLLYDKWFLGNSLPNCLDEAVLEFIFYKNENDNTTELSFELEKKFKTKHNIWASNLGLKKTPPNHIFYGQQIYDKWYYPIEPWGHLMYSLNVEAKDDYANFFEKIPIQIVKDVNNNLGKIIINYAHEGWVSEWLLKGIYLGAKNRNINLDNIILILNDYNLKTKLELFKEKYDIEKFAKIINYSFYLKASSTYFFNKHRITDLKSKHKKVKNNKFLCLNRRLDLHRVKLICEIYNDIKNDSIISFDKNLITGEVSKFLIENNLLEKYDALPNKIVADRDDIENTNGYHHENENLYLDSYFSIVTETSFYIDNDFISEKIWKPLYNFHPFIVVGRPHLLKYLKEIGFKTFDWLINEEYDNIEDNDKRMEYIVYEIQKLNKLSLQELHDKINENFDSLLHNHNLLNSFGSKTAQIERFLIENIKKDNYSYSDIFKEFKLDYYYEKII
jgi:hypothetical protein